MCALVAAISDDLVESDEDFRIELNLVEIQGSSLSLGNTETVVTIIDSDGM